MSELKKEIEETAVNIEVSLASDVPEQLDYDNVRYFLTELTDKATLAERERISELLEPKSVDELKEIMGETYNNLSVQVAYKEGYNRKGKEIDTILNNQDNE